MIDDFLPEPHPSGALVPPPRNPPTALATADALPPRRSSPDITTGDGLLRQIVETTLDSLDSLGDSIAGVIGLR